MSEYTYSKHKRFGEKTMFLKQNQLNRNMFRKLLFADFTVFNESKKM